MRIKLGIALGQIPKREVKGYMKPFVDVVRTDSNIAKIPVADKNKFV